MVSGGVEDVQEYFVNNIEEDYKNWLKADLVELGVEAEMIAKMEIGGEIIDHRGKCGGIGEPIR